MLMSRLKLRIDNEKDWIDVQKKCFEHNLGWYDENDNKSFELEEFDFPVMFIYVHKDYIALGVGGHEGEESHFKNKKYKEISASDFIKNF